MTWLAQRPVERVSSWSLELESGIVDFLSEILSQRRRGTETQSTQSLFSRVERVDRVEFYASFSASLIDHIQ